MFTILKMFVLYIVCWENGWTAKTKKLDLFIPFLSQKHQMVTIPERNNYKDHAKFIQKNNHGE